MNRAELERFNADWLNAWTDKDVDRLLSFYHPEVTYRDPQTAPGLQGQDALRSYLEKLFGATPPMRYEPDEVWPIEGGYCGRWYCRIGEPPARTIRGFDLVLMDEGRIRLNEVYTHDLGSA
jgi:hypothetical protein